MLNQIKQFYQKNTFLCILEVITFFAVLITGILFHQSAWRMLPLFISLVIMFLQAQVNRYAFLLGACNSVLYAVSYVSMTLYANAAYALLISCPLQVITFINWQKKSNGSQTTLRRLTTKQLILLISLCIVSWLGLFLVFSLFNSSYMILDNTTTLLGIVTTILSMLRFMEYTAFQIVGSTISLVMHITIFMDTPSQITYAIFTTYSIICTILAIIRMYKTQKAAKEAPQEEQQEEAAVKKS